jgi:hypothetical protein
MTSEIKTPAKKHLVRKLAYSVLCIVFIWAIIAKSVFWYKVSKYKNGKEQLELEFKKDDRFRDVRIYFSPTRPSAFVVAPNRLSPNSKQDLEHLVTSAFTSLPVRVRYAGTNYFGGENETNK